jgi:hypothetical protein
MTSGYCVKCKQNKEMKDESESMNSRGVNMAKGYCPICGTKMCRMLGKKY